MNCKLVLFICLVLSAVNLSECGRRRRRWTFDWDQKLSDNEKSLEQADDFSNKDGAELLQHLNMQN
uniref:Uncharacterized protein n=1 Tax=Ciona intestinalis TaxID=7719 RepID=F6YXV1_CIOIN